MARAHPTGPSCKELPIRVYVRFPDNRSAKPDVLPGGAAKTRFMANM